MAVDRAFVQNITDGAGLILAVVVKSDFFVEDGIEFFTEQENDLQLGYMRRPVGYQILPHVHGERSSLISTTQEVLFIKSGRVLCSVFDDCHNPIADLVLAKGDFVLFASGGHGFEMLEDSEIVEVKQGPYDGRLDKVRFSGADGA